MCVTLRLGVNAHCPLLSLPPGQRFLSAEMGWVDTSLWVSPVFTIFILVAGREGTRAPLLPRGSWGQAGTAWSKSAEPSG